MEKIKRLDETFAAVSKLISYLPDTGPIDAEIETKLELYALFKIATGAALPDKKPSVWDTERRLKWIAWNERSYLSPDEAKYLYVKIIGDVLKSIYYSGKSDEYLENTTLDFLFKLDRDELKLLFDNVLVAEDAEEDIKQELVKLKCKYAPDLF
ncbi:hypothetical protein AV955_gp059 [Diadromus pulchellus ascovirus 4a]|uniref:Complete DpAV4 genome n=1 Tax=Diadromus pulchellus ascovirus 4a TaxID=158683 RepID=F2NYY8_9VIRU|nr:hypothetical protein AV955_gp059 [Diadromus pulchellus ascovirus 4a]CCA61416.1 unnamed protein product [Diadromus pulchellus ascovirus 4a]